MNKVKLEPPSSFDMPRKRPRYLLLILFILALVVAFALGLRLLFWPAARPEPYDWEIGRFSGEAKVYSKRTREWITVTRRTHRQIRLLPGDKIQTAEGADLDLSLENVFDLRLKPSSELELLPKKRGSKGQEAAMRLNQGSLVGMFKGKSGKDRFQVLTPLFSAAIHDALFLVEAEPKSGSSLAILEGNAEVRAHRSKESFSINALEILKAGQGEKVIPKPERIDYQKWRALNEVRDLIEVSPEEMAAQLDLRDEAGSFFEYVFDEGVFYKPHWGYTSREFYKEEHTGSVILRIDYDVYPQGCYAGLYFKTRDLDLSKVRHLSFDLKAEAGRPVPQQFRIEFKDRFSIVRGFSVKPIGEEWQTYGFDLNVQRPTPVTEMVFVFENSKIGPLSTNGTLYLKDLHIE